ncbi:GNAT domain-containing protein [Abortiporus biennis]|nr:GNAT domain-containing protein [Abortiporus biennis]
MAHRQLHPLQFDPRTSEPFLQLPSPHENIIITPPRMEDAPYCVEYLNDPKICRWMGGIPFPYTADHADGWLQTVKSSSDEILKELKEADDENPDGPLLTASGFPLRALREVKEDGSQIFIGDIGVFRCFFHGVLDPLKVVHLTEENRDRAVGDPQIIWCFGDYLASSHHGRGIMSVAVGTIIREWMVPRMNVHLIRAETFTGNIGSVRVFEKNGFELEETVEFAEPRVLNSGVAQYGTNVLWWRR